MTRKICLALALLVLATGCTTTGTFKVPSGTDLYVYKRPQPVDIKADGKVTTKPFLWTAAGVPLKGAFLTV